MRSRYAAYALKLADYIMDTTDPLSPHYETNRSNWKENILDFGNLQFTGLDILEEKEDTVTFKAHLKQANQDVSFTEKSLFTRLNGRWYYFRKEE